MNWKSFTAGVFAKPLLLVMMLSLVGCQSIQTTRTAETEEKIAEDTCSVWKAVTYSSRDTPETQLEVRANNAARKAYCGA